MKSNKLTPTNGVYYCLLGGLGTLMSYPSNAFTSNLLKDNNKISYVTFSNDRNSEILQGSTSSENIVNNRARLSKLIQNQKILHGIQSLRLNWNNNGASAFNKEHIAFVQDLILELRYQPKIFPTSRNSIQLEYQKSSGEYLEFELYSDNRIQMYLENKNSEYEKTIKIEEIHNIINEFCA